LIRQTDIPVFVHAMEGFREELREAESRLEESYTAIQADARQRLGRLFDPKDYPSTVRGLFDLAWDFPSVEPPAYLMQIAPDVYEEERRRVVGRFEEAVKLAEQAFTTEFAKLLAHLTERLEEGENGSRKVFRDSAVTNLTNFFDRFRMLNVSSNPQLDALVEEARRLVAGVGPQVLRDDAALRGEVAEAMSGLQARVESLITEVPRRRIVRARPTAEGNGHAPEN
jgi:hypothetical protein